MATITLLNTSTYILNEGSRCRVTKGSTDYYTQGDTFTGTSFECLVWRNADVAVGKTSGVYLGTTSIALTTSNTGSNIQYTYRTGNVSKVEIQFVDAFTAGSAGWKFQSIKILPCPKITYSVPSGATAPASQEVKTGNTLTSANLPSVSLSGYIFNGWYYDSAYSMKAEEFQSISTTEDFTLYAKFTPNTDIKTSIKSIVIPEGEVKSISVGGVVIWSKPVTEGWHTIWSGTATVSNKKGSISGTNNSLCSSASGTGVTPKIRVTFSWPSGTSNNNNSAYYYVNGSGSSSAPTSPVEMTTTSSENTNLVGRQNEYYNSSYNYEDRYVALQKTNSGTDHVVFKLAAWSALGSATGNAQVNTSMTITKIEQYY